MNVLPPGARRATFAILGLTLALGCGGDDDESRDAGRADAGRGDAATRDASTADAAQPDARVDADMDGATDDAAVPSACELPPPIDEGVSYERTLYVEAGATGGDGSAARPFGDIEEAARAATPGTRVVVRAGTYDRVGSISPQGEAGRPIKFEAEGEVVIDAGAGNTGWSMSDPRYVVVEGFTIRNAGVHGMNIDDGGTFETPGQWLVLRRLHIPAAGSGGNNDCIKLSGIDDFWVLDSDVAGCDRGEIIDMVGCHRGVIAGNRFSSPVGNGVQAKGGSSDTIITGNVFTDIPGRAVNAGGSTGLAYFRPMDAPYEAARIRVVANLFLRGGTDSGAPIAFVGCDGCSFVNNTVVQPSTWIARILQESRDARFVPSREGLFANNVVVLDTGDLRTFFNVGDGTAPETFTFANNLWFALDQGPDWSGPNYAAASIPAGTDELVQVDPRMVDRAGGDYRLQADSPARGAGRDPGFPLPPDLDGACYADPPTLGAWEIP